MRAFSTEGYGAIKSYRAEPTTYQAWRGVRLTFVVLIFSLVIPLFLGIFSSFALAQSPEGSVEKIYEPSDVKFAAFHRLAVNDRLKISFFDGRTLHEWEVVVDGDGNINLPFVGKLSVAGLYPREAAKTLTDKFKKYYLSPWVSVEVVHFGEFEVFIFGTDFSGQVIRMRNGSRLLDALGKAGVDSRGKYRRIHLIRGGIDFSSFIRDVPSEAVDISEEEGAIVIKARRPQKDLRYGRFGVIGGTNWRAWIEERKKDPLSKVYIIDPLVAVLHGDTESANPTLKPGDVIFVPAPEKSVEIYGVAKPGVYELLEEETLGDLLYLAGSVDFGADLKNSIVERRDENGRLKRLVVNLSGSKEGVKQAESFPLMGGDVVRIIPYERRVFVLGEVFRAGAFAYSPNMTIADYLALAGGMTDNANTGWLQIIRHPRELAKPQKPTEVITVNFKKLQKGHPPPVDYSILPGDVIYVPPKGFKMTYPMVVQTVATLLTGFGMIETGGGETRPRGQEPTTGVAPQPSSSQ